MIINNNPTIVLAAATVVSPLVKVLSIPAKVKAASVRTEKNTAYSVHHGRNDTAYPFSNALKNPIQHAVLPRVVTACNQWLQIGYGKSQRIQDNPGNHNTF